MHRNTIDLAALGGNITPLYDRLAEGPLKRLTGESERRRSVMLLPARLWRNRKLLRAAVNGRPSFPLGGLEQEPRSPLGFIDPDLDQAGVATSRCSSQTLWASRRRAASVLLSSHNSASMSSGST